MLTWIKSLKKPPAKTNFTTHGRWIIAIGDIHGRLDCLHGLLKNINTWKKAREIRGPVQLIFLGDYIDRGPQVRAVIDSLLLLRRDGAAICLAGNHEQALVKFIAGAFSYRDYLFWGGEATIRSYGVTPCEMDADEAQIARVREALREAIPAQHLTFLGSLPVYHTIGDYIFVHGGLRPGIPLEKQSPDDLMYIRDEFLNAKVTVPQRIVHGHTIFNPPRVKGQMIGVDTGAYKTDILTGVIIQNNNYSFISNKEIPDVA